MRVDRLVLGELATNTWVVSDDLGGPALVIDPAGHPSDAARIIEAAAGRPIEIVVLTHAHFDHLGSARSLLEMTGASLAIHEIDAPRVTSSAFDGTGGALFGFTDTAPPADRILKDASRLESGALELTVWLTPGHTAGSICLLAGEHGVHDPRDDESPQADRPDHLFSGDTLFAGSVGRTDFPAGDSRALQRSIARLATLPDSTVVHPGHGPDTTMGRERRMNPFFPRA